MLARSTLTIDLRKIAENARRVTSALAGQHDAAGQFNAYGPQNLFDGNPATAWCEGVFGPGNGQEIVVDFARALIVSQISGQSLQSLRWERTSGHSRGFRGSAISWSRA